MLFDTFHYAILIDISSWLEHSYCIDCDALNVQGRLCPQYRGNLVRSALSAPRPRPNRRVVAGRDTLDLFDILIVHVEFHNYQHFI